ncbi:MAG: hypothetical protein O7E57_15940 [Gammaproteobacteria bacterium]|nr:hypothetical protein [Gammaproteobacteria bacterium]
MAFTVSGCGGSGGSSGKSPAQNQTSTPPAGVNLSASATLISPGDSVTLSWSTSNATECRASGGWSGNKALSGNSTVTGITQDTNFRLSCSGAGGGGLAEVTVQANSAETEVTLTASPRDVLTNGSSVLTWSSTNASSCSAAGDWSGSQPLSGSFDTGALPRDATYRLTCDGQTSAVAMVTVRVLSKSLEWRAPTQNEDGSALTDLAGYVVYWGAQSRNYTGSHTINSPTITQWDVTVSPGLYFFAVTALDSGGIESQYSNEIAKTIP